MEGSIYDVVKVMGQAWERRDKGDKKNNKEWRVWELKDKNRTEISNHQYQSWNF